MEDILAKREPRVFPFLGGLPDGNLAPLLGALTQEGSPALRCWPPNVGPGWGNNAWGYEVVLPLTAPPSFEGMREWLGRALAAIRRDGRPLGSEAQHLLAATLAPGEPREDGLPAYLPSGPHVGGAEAAAARGTLRMVSKSPGEDYDYDAGRTIFREIVDYERESVSLPNGREATLTATTWRAQERRSARGVGRNATAPIRDILAAVAHDLLALRAHEVGACVLGHIPNGDRFRQVAGIGARVPDLAERSSSWRSGGSSPYEAWRRGRSMLAQLGAWPWAHAPEGKLPRRWRSDSGFIEPLQRFLEAQEAA